MLLTSFRMHERDTATEKKIDTVLQMILENVQVQSTKQSTKWTVKVTNISKYV